MGPLQARKTGMEFAQILILKVRQEGIIRVIFRMITLMLSISLEDIASF